jgi:hypothetical protein
MAEYSPEDYALATKLNAKLATSDDPALVTQARELANRMLEHVRGKVTDYEDFVRRVHISEQFSLTESMQVGKTEKELKQIYLRASGLLETAAEAAARANRRRRVS